MDRRISMNELLNELDAAILAQNTHFDEGAAVTVKFSEGQWQRIQRLVADAKREQATGQAIISAPLGLSQDQEDRLRGIVRQEIARYVGDQEPYNPDADDDFNADHDPGEDGVLLPDEQPPVDSKNPDDHQIVS